MADETDTKIKRTPVELPPLKMGVAKAQIPKRKGSGRTPDPMYFKVLALAEKAIQDTSKTFFIGPDIETEKQFAKVSGWIYRAAKELSDDENKYSFQVYWDEDNEQVLFKCKLATTKNGDVEK